MTDVQETWKKHGWVPPSQQEQYTNYWDSIKNAPPQMKIPDIHILQVEEPASLGENVLIKNTCRF